jgi:TM2 domain-containing membrane protein YozV
MAETKFCGECGTKLKGPEAKVCLKCGSDPANATNFCTNCGAKRASPNAVACTSCGGKLTKGPSEKDPAIAALISVLCLFVLGAPSIGYIYLGNVRKGIIYLGISWALVFAVVAAYFIGGSIFGIMTYGVGFLCCLPVFLLPVIFDLLIVYDVYLEAKGEPTKLPNF